MGTGVFVKVFIQSKRDSTTFVRHRLGELIVRLGHVPLGSTVMCSVVPVAYVFT